MSFNLPMPTILPPVESLTVHDTVNLRNACLNVRGIYKRVCCQSISETLNESRKRTRTFSGLFVRICTLTYCIPYILHVHDRKVVCFSNISAYFARNAESLITQGSSRKSCSLAGGFVPTRSHRGRRARRYLVVIRVLAFVSSGVMISIKSIDVHIGHESSVGVCFAKRSRIYRIGKTPLLASCLSV